MRRLHGVEHRFARNVPDTLEPGVLYISMDFATAIHLCACGCGREVVTPFTPRDWHMKFDGETVSLSPSIGNWNYPCRSHYWIRHNRVIWIDVWSYGWGGQRNSKNRRKGKWFDWREWFGSAGEAGRNERKEP